MRFFVFALIAIVVQSIKLTTQDGPFMRDMALVQTTLGGEGPADLIAALRAAVADDKQMTLPQFKKIVVDWLTKHHGAEKVA